VGPRGATPRNIGVEARAAIRARFHLPPEALILGAFGILSQSKMNVEAIEAFRALALERPDSLFVLAGEDYEDGEAQRKVEELGLDGRVVFLGRVTDADFADLIAAVDVGVCLRRPPTYGETSAALLDLLRHGVPTIVTDVATFADYPDAVVRKVRWPAEGLDGLTRAVLDLAADAEAREALGLAALRYVRDNHSWSAAAAGYAEVLNRLAAGSQRAETRPIRVSVSPWSRSA
jgi:glycosyltransferase involved in cell wall biosynthesis